MASTRAYTDHADRSQHLLEHSRTISLAAARVRDNRCSISASSVTSQQRVTRVMLKPQVRVTDASLETGDSQPPLPGVEAGTVSPLPSVAWHYSVVTRRPSSRYRLDISLLPTLFPFPSPSSLVHLASSISNELSSTLTTNGLLDTRRCYCVSPASVWCL